MYKIRIEFIPANIVGTDFYTAIEIFKHMLFQKTSCEMKLQEAEFTYEVIIPKSSYSTELFIESIHDQCVAYASVSVHDVNVMDDGIYFILSSSNGVEEYVPDHILGRRLREGT